MKFVSDASVGLKWVLDEPGSGKALQLREEFRAGLHRLLAPDVFVIEVAHVLSKAERQRKLKPGQADVLLSDVLKTPPTLSRYLPLLPRAMELSREARMGVYDCLYVALAEAEQCEVVTADERIAKALPDGPVKFLDSL
jgi:predicted nucleic acid-binding protein